MGAEAKCMLTLGRTKTEGKALLETDALMFRGGEVRLSIPYKAISALEAKDGALRVAWPEGTASFALGAAASKWAEKIRNPPRRIDKLGIKAGQKVLLVGLADPALRGDIESVGAVPVTRATTPVDVVFYAADTRASLAQLGDIRQRITPNGAIWIVRPKGSAAISEADVMRAGKAAGLVDVKVVRFSDTHTAEKFVIPVRSRKL